MEWLDVINILIDTYLDCDVMAVDNVPRLLVHSEKLSLLENCPNRLQIKPIQTNPNQ